MITQKKPPNGEKTIYCKKDRPLESRVPFSFLLGLKKELVQWGYKGSVRVEEIGMKMTFQGTSVLSAQVREGQLHLDWLPGWLEWSELQNSTEMTALKDKAAETLKGAYEKGGKGDGKGNGPAIGGNRTADTTM